MSSENPEHSAFENCCTSLRRKCEKELRLVMTIGHAFKGSNHWETVEMVCIDT